MMLGANPYASNGSLCTAPDFPGRMERIRERGGKIVVVDVMMDDQLLSNIQSSIQKHIRTTISVQGVRCDISKPEDCRRGNVEGDKAAFVS
jgi:hypothetical protein